MYIYLIIEKKESAFNYLSIFKILEYIAFKSDMYVEKNFVKR